MRIIQCSDTIAMSSDTDVLEQQEGDPSTSRVSFVASGHPQLS